MSRDTIATCLVWLALRVATPRFRARVHVAMLRAQGVEPSDRLLRAASWERRPGQ